MIEERLEIRTVITNEKEKTLFTNRGKLVTHKLHHTQLNPSAICNGAAPSKYTEVQFICNDHYFISLHIWIKVSVNGLRTTINLFRLTSGLSASESNQLKLYSNADNLTIP